MRIKQPLLAAMLTLGMHICKAQSTSPDVMASAGNCFIAPDASLSWTLGEMVTETDASTSNYLTQGFQQPRSIIVTDVTSPVNNKGSISAFPNPFTSSVSLQNNTEGQTLHVNLIDMEGKTIMKRTMVNKQEQFDLSSYSNGIYFLEVYDESNKLIQNLKIDKTK